MATQQKSKIKIDTSNIGRMSEEITLVQVKLRRWSISTVDDEITEEVAHDKEISKDMGVYRKKLIEGCTEWKALMKNHSDIRDEFNSLTVAWTDKGTRAIRNTKLMDFSDKMYKKSLERKVLVYDWLDAYPKVRDKMIAKYPKILSKKDYPTEAEMETKFAFSWRPLPFPKGEHFESRYLSEADIEKFRADIDKAMKDQLEESMKEPYTRLIEAIKHMSDKLKGYTGGKEGSFKNTLIGNITELCDVMPYINITGDPNLDSFVAEIKKELTNYDCEILRKDEAVREVAQTKAEEIYNRMKIFM